jgi:DNA primase
VELVDFQYEMLRKKDDEHTLAGRRAIASQMLLTAHKSPNTITREAWIQKTANALGISEVALRTEMRRIRGNYRPFGRGGLGTSLRQEVRENFAEVERERNLIGYMLGYEKVRSMVAESLRVEDFTDTVCRRVVETILSLHKQGKGVKAEALLSVSEDSQEAELMSGFALEPLESEKPEEAAAQAIDMIVRQKRSREIKELQEKIARAEREGGDWRPLQAECLELLRGQKAIDVETKRY